MKLPIPFLLYLVSVGLLGFAGWTVYKVLPQWKGEARTAATNRGFEEATDRLDKGKSQGKQSVDWDYGPSTMPWWDTLKVANLTGKLPPPPKEKGPDVPPPPPVADVRPLEELIELVSLVYDGQHAGKGGNSHVIVRFKEKDGVNVRPPEWYVRENAPPTPGSGAPSAMPVPVRGDTTPARGGNRPAAQPIATKNGGGRATSSPPTSSANNRETLQKLWVQDGGDPRRSAELWPVQASDPGATLGKFRLVRVAEDAQSAWFVRELPPPKAGEPAPPPKEEELFKTSANLSQDVLQELKRMQGEQLAITRRAPEREQGDNTPWVNSKVTEKFGNVVNIGLDDEARFRDTNDDVFDQIHVEPYVSKDGKSRGLIVKGVDADLARRFGVSPGEVLIEVNGKRVESQAQAIQSGKKDYQKGVRTFVTKWMVNGAEIERTFRAPDKK